MRDLSTDEVMTFLTRILDALRGGWSAQIIRDDDGLPQALAFEGPGGVFSEPISLRLSQRTLGVGREVVNLGHATASPRLFAVLALELAAFLAASTDPLVRPRRA